jgi:hypothetical protein
MGMDQSLFGFDDKAEGRKYLERMGCRHGAERSWLEPDRTWVGVILSQYGSESEARVVATGGPSPVRPAALTSLVVTLGGERGAGHRS